MALCLPNERMLQLTFPPGSFGRGEEVFLKTLADSQQHLLTTIFKKINKYLRDLQDNGLFMIHYAKMI